MPASQKSISLTPEVKNERLALAGALTTIANRADGWMKSLEDFKTLRQDLLTNLENELQTLKRQKEDAEAEFEQSKRNKRIHIEQELSEFGYEAAQNILKNRNETPITISELDALRQKVQTLETQHQQELSQALEVVRQQTSQTLKFEKQTLQLQHEKEAASLTSQVESLNKQLTMAKDELCKGEIRLEAQRELSKSIADACKTPAIVQNMNK